MKLTIVTISFNAAKEIERTILSVIKQDTQCEFFVIDGGSTDQTIDIVKKHNVKYISEKDKGIYDAMNKGVKLAKGDYILFLNAGDYLAHDHAISDVLDYLDDDIVYTDFVYSGYGLFSKTSPLPLETIKQGMPFCHQAVFAKRKLLLKHPFDLNYKISADYDFFVRMYNLKKSFKYVPLTTTVYELGGVSYTNIEGNMKEVALIQKNAGLDESDIAVHIKETKKRMRVQKLLPHFLANFLTKTKHKLQGWKATDEYNWFLN